MVKVAAIPASTTILLQHSVSVEEGVHTLDPSTIVLLGLVVIDGGWCFNGLDLEVGKLLLWWVKHGRLLLPMLQ